MSQEYSEMYLQPTDFYEIAYSAARGGHMDIVNYVNRAHRLHS